MKVLLLHPADNLPRDRFAGWDLIVDFGRAPASTYEDWSKQTACPIISIYEFAKEIDDLRLCRNLLQLGFGRLMDAYGIDWWDVSSLAIVPDLVKLVLVDRAAKYIDQSCELYSTRPFPFATALQNRLRCTLTIPQRPFQSLTRRLRHYSSVLSKLDGAQLSQVIEDKFDRHHAVRRRLTGRKRPRNAAAILLPSAYVNVSRMAVRYAELLPDRHFLLVYARRSGKLQSLPANVFMTPLESYFESTANEEGTLCDRWHALREELVYEEEIFEAADRAGMLEKVGSGLRWGLRVRDAWRNVLDREPILGCLSADDTNPYTRIPLLLAKSRGIPTVACHHGALDCWMMLKNLTADAYLAKTQMECDYLNRTCHIAREKIVLGGPAQPHRSQPTMNARRTWMVFFTEPYEARDWRSEDVYRDLLPRLCSLAENCGLKLVFKLHPFESIRGHRKKLRHILGQKERGIEVLAGPPNDELWQNAKFALTVESSTALECAARGIPVFLCGWLRDPHAGYAQQYARFGAGRLLESPDEIEDIPRLLGSENRLPASVENAIDPRKFRELFSIHDCLAAASNA